jgi:hypothetical protein
MLDILEDIHDFAPPTPQSESDRRWFSDPYQGHRI